MSVIGFDVGNDASCVALARKRGIDVLMNKESKRETPSIVSFGEKMRFIGTDGAGKVSMNPKNTPHQLKRLLGKRFDDPAVQSDLALLPFKVTAGPAGECLVHVNYCNEPHVFTPEQLVAMLLVDLKRIAEAEGGIPVTDAVLSCPAYFTEAERYATLNAATIAGVNVLRLINETTATALAYGLYKTDLPETDPVHVAFVDVGHSSTQVSVVSFKKSGLTVKAHAWDCSAGGRDLDELLFDHFVAEFKSKTGLDIKTNAKAAFKLRTAVEKVKKMLSANAEAPLNVECIMEDTDLRSAMTREQLEGMAGPLLVRIRAALQRGVDAAGMSLSDISVVEVIGGATRTPAILQLVEEVFGQAPSRTLHTKEVVCRGCALQCAILSPVFKVREFEVNDVASYPITFTWDKDGVPATQTLFERFSPFPVTKAITFARSEAFTLTAAYGEDGSLPPGASRSLGTYTVGPFKVPDGAEKAKLKVKVAMNLNGLVSVPSAQLIEEEEVEVPVAAAPKADAAAAAAPGAAVPDAAAGADGPTPMEAEAGVASAAGAEGAGAAAVEKKKRVKKTDIPVAAAGVAGFSQKQLDAYFEQEGSMQASDKLQEDTNEAKNALEAYIYSLRSKLYEGLAPYVREPDREALAATLTSMEDWLYDEGEDETKSTYVAKLVELRRRGDPIEARAAEDGSRGGAGEALRRAAEGYLGVAGSALPSHAHLDAGERGTLEKEAREALAWLDEKTALQAQLHKYDEPVLLTSDIQKKLDVLDRVCKPIATKKPPPPAAAPAPAVGRGEPGAAAGTGTAGGSAAAGDGEEEAMETEASGAAEAADEGAPMEH